MSLLQVSEAFCFICRGVLIDPVTLPCFHVFCLNCFEQSMQETSHSCPLCRKRISNWIRSVKKSNKLIDVKLWEKIKEQFKEEVRLKLNGEDDGLDQIMQNQFKIQIPASRSGEVAQEFSKLLEDFRQEREKLKEAEELASKKLIEKLTIEEEERLQIIREKNLMRLRQDEKLAQMMQEELKKEVLDNVKSERKTRNSKPISTPKGPMDNFLKGLSVLNQSQSPSKEVSPLNQSKEKNEGDESPDSTDSLRMEMNLFKPIKKVLRTPPKRYPDGRIREISLTRVTPVKLSSTDAKQSSSEMGIIEGKRIHSAHSAFVDAIAWCPKTSDSIESSSPKRLKFSLDEMDIGILKDITLGENNDSNSTQCSNTQDDPGKRKPVPQKQIQDVFPFRSGEKEDEENDLFETQDYLSPSSEDEEKLIEEQMRIEQIILQEKKDRELAMRLSREWETETEIRRKPQTRSMIADAVKKKKNSLKSTKGSQTTLTDKGAICRKTRKK